MGKTKDKSGFERVYHANKELVFKTAMRYSDNRYHIAQEITQDVFLQLYSHFDEFDEDYLTAWLVSVTKNKALNYLQRSRWEQGSDDIGGTVNVHAMEKSTEEQVFDQIEFEEKVQLGQSILDRLYEVNERWYEAMTMVYCMGKKQKDVAKELGISIEVLNSVLYRARKWVKNHYEEEE